MELTIGAFTLKPYTDYPDGSKSILIEGEDGEGGQFPAEKVEEALRKFYDENL